MARQWTPEQRAAFAENMKARRAQKQQQTQTSSKQTVEEPQPTQAAPQAAAQGPFSGPVQNLSFTPEQFEQLMAALTSGQVNNTPPQAFSNTTTMQTNAQGQAVGVITKYNPDPTYYPDPTEELTKWMDDNPKTRRFAFSQNYYLTWEITANPYQTKFNTNVQEPTFHVTLFANVYDDDGEERDVFRLVQSYHFNEDEAVAFEIALANGMEPTQENMRETLNLARKERIRRWLLGVYFPENNFDLNIQSSEEAIGGQVVKVITKSNVKGFGNGLPRITDEELA